MGNFGPGMGPMDGRHAAMQMRNYMNNSAHYGASNGQHNGGQMPPGANPNAMSPHAVSRIQQMNARQMAAMGMRQPNMMAPNMKTTNMRSAFPGQQPNMGLTQERLHQANVQQLQAAQMQQQAASGAKWHTPQQKQTSNGAMGMMGMSMSPPANASGSLFPDTFKIPLRSPDTLKNQTNMNGSSSSSGSFPLPNVSSTNPKTPSPSQKDQQKEIDNIDSVCNESVNDLLATIAKLDSNGVQVLPEGRNKATSPQVHSSTDNIDPNSSLVSMNDKNNQPKDDPNEDWCACCMDGGELMCCDKCPKVFHQACHIPVISSLPDESETWQCLLCYNFSDATKGET
jgi:tripartite motif-containing protein 33